MWIALGVPIFVLVAVAIMYNRLVRARNHCDEAWSDVDTELQRRYNLIPSLVNTVKGYAQHERKLLEQVTQLREECAHNHGTPKQQAQSENRFQHALGALMARIENYPDLKASGNFLSLQHELTNTEDRIQAARRFYNGNVRENNNRVQSVPSNIIANLFGFGSREFFELDTPAARTTPQVKL